ncbi:HlyU family transcriptional regulator [Salibaculum sp.]|uniref:HlyU family transcriptional regulator n=1 Tax=Salibaculum sp. TaxID=2855480 RepID=UPI002B4884FB|nr:HlyU family transcriptional regulator [Salibaculum sp.]HKL68802.1 HlyU family transcriptional regulator [Salibaculum sp.]
MSLLKKLFGGGGGNTPEEAEPLAYNGYRIFAEPMKAEGGYRIAGRIEREVGGETKTHRLIRADVVADRDQAVDATLQKCRQVIDQQGDGIF